MLTRCLLISVCHIRLLTKRAESFKLSCAQENLSSVSKGYRTASVLLNKSIKVVRVDTNANTKLYRRAIMVLLPVALKIMFLCWGGDEPGCLYWGHYMTHWPAPNDDYGVVRGMVARGNRSNRGKPSAVPLCLPQIPHVLNRRLHLSYDTAKVMLHDK
jgi:hypothetical protein